MRIAIVSRIYRPEPSAASMFLGAVADALLQRGHDIEVLTARPPAGTAQEPTAERVRTAPVLRDRNGYVRGYLQYLSFDVPLALRLLFLKRPDAILVEPPPTTGLVVRLIAGLRRIPYVYDLADVWSDAAAMATDSGLVLRVLRRIEGFALRGARRLVTISDGVVARARRLGVSAPVDVTGFGADTRAFSPDPAVPVQPLFVYAGSYSVWHGAEVLIDAFARFRAEHPGFRLRFIGNGSERDDLARRAVELGVAESVEFLDPLPVEDLLPHLRAATASLATLKPGTRYEYAFTTKAYSSTAAGCPVIFAGPGPTRDFVAAAGQAYRGGIACDYSPEAVASAMASLADAPLSPRERADLGAWTEREHSLAAVAERVADVVEAAGSERA